MNKMIYGIKVWLEYRTRQGRSCTAVEFSRDTDIRSALEMLAAESVTETNVEPSRFMSPKGMMNAKDTYEESRILYEKNHRCGEFLEDALYVVNSSDPEKTARIIERFSIDL